VQALLELEGVEGTAEEVIGRGQAGAVGGSASQREDGEIGEALTEGRDRGRILGGAANQDEVAGGVG
jgi:hypothetical protein